MMGGIHARGFRRSHRIWVRIVVLAGVLCSGALLSARAEEPSASPSLVPPGLVRSLNLKAFYKQYVDAHGIPVIASEKPSPYAVREAAYLVGQMLAGRDDLRRAIAGCKVRVVVMAVTEATTAVPEHSDLTPSAYWDRRARGLGATRARPAISCAEENLLCYPGDPYTGENILIHEFGHTIHQMGVRPLDQDFDRRLKAAYEAALAAGKWKDTYAATNPSEYWAEGVQSWFDCNQSKNPVHNGVRTREQLTEYDPELAKLLASVFTHNEWRYLRRVDRKEPAHLAGYDPSRAPRFRWNFLVGMDGPGQSASP